MYNLFFRVFCFELIYFWVIDKQETVAPISSIGLIQIFLGCVKLIGYFASAVNVVTSNPCVGSPPKIKLSLFLLPI